jgi:hypothetical protein
MAYGQPYLEKKIEILIHNIKMIKEQLTLDDTIDILINAYDNDNLNDIKEYCEKNEIGLTIKERKGVLAELTILNFGDNKFSFVEKYDYIFCMFDDVEYVSINLSRLINLVNNNNLDILSTCVDENKSIRAHDIMFKKNNNGCYITRFAEHFCWFMKRESFKRFCNELDINNTWMWGMDTLLPCVKNFKTAIDYEFISIHHYRAKAGEGGKKKDQMMLYLNKNGVKNFYIDFKLYDKLD